MNQQAHAQAMQKVIAKAWSDDGFKQQLLSDPASALKQEGIEVPAGLNIKTVENTDEVFHLVLPSKPSNSELAYEQLDAIAGGSCGGCFSTFCN